jgi:hypothetical protein
MIAAFAVMTSVVATASFAATCDGIFACESKSKASDSKAGDNVGKATNSNTGNGPASSRSASAGR